MVNADQVVNRVYVPVWHQPITSLQVNIHQGEA